MQTLNCGTISTKLQRLATLAKEHPDWTFKTLAHIIDIEFLEEAHRRTRKDGAPGVDGQTAAEYAENLEENLQSLLARFKAGTYRAPPVKQVYIPKSNGRELRPIGIPSYEDKVLQRAVTMVLEAIYEQDFEDFSYGFRPRRSAHQALRALWKGLMNLDGGWVLDVDIESFFETIDHKQLKIFLDQRVGDGVLRRVIHKWLKAGALDASGYQRRTRGTPQGGVISPLLANVYLHEVLDTWFAMEVQPRLSGRSFMIRYADDCALVFETKKDVERVKEVLAKRLAKYGLKLHPVKTRQVNFEKPTDEVRDDDDDDQRPRPGTFDMLGFTHSWGPSRRGAWIVKQTTSSKSLSLSLGFIRRWCRRYRHESVANQHAALNGKLRGYYGYYGIVGNARALYRFLVQVKRAWRTWLDRRTGRTTMPWARYQRLLDRYPLQRPRIVH